MLGSRYSVVKRCRGTINVLVRPERLLLGWLGPRGAASIVFGLLAFNVLDGGDGHSVLLTMVVVVLGSVLLHGFGVPAASRAFARAPSE